LSRYLLDTNMASFVIKGNFPTVRQKLLSIPIQDIAISAVTEAELRYGLTRKGSPAALAGVISAFFRRVAILPWDSKAAQAYGDLRTLCSNRGVALSALDMMIAAHAVAIKATLVTHDGAFLRVPDGVLTTEDWTR
jgi:tRNA(fMet)-specific endonuclease VapC